jgi:hypothetical protein
VPSCKSSRIRLSIVFFVCVLIAACLLPVAIAGVSSSKDEPQPSIRERGPQPAYSVVAGLDGDIFPVFANFFSFQKQSQRDSGIITITIRNSSNSLMQNRVAVQIPGWSDQEIQLVELAAGQVRKVQFAPTFLPRLYHNREIAAATAMVTVSDMGGHGIWSTTVPVRLRSADDMYWGKDFANASFIASWVTPHDPNVEMTLSKAKEFMPGRRLPGYEIWRAPGVQEKTTYLEAKAIYQALQRQGVSYVKSSATLGAHINFDVTERVRMPAESLRQVSANCIDGVVLYASLFENLDMEPVVVLVPGHAYIGVRLSPDSPNYLYLDTALTGRASFETAVGAAERGLARHKPSEIIRIPISAARQAGIYPMPSYSTEQSTFSGVVASAARESN